MHYSHFVKKQNNMIKKKKKTLGSSFVLKFKMYISILKMKQCMQIKKEKNIACATHPMRA